VSSNSRGNENAALPLLAACFVDARRVWFDQHPLASRTSRSWRTCSSISAARVEGLGTTTLRVQCSNVTKDEPDPALVGRLRGSVLLLGRCWRGAVARPPRLQEATFRPVARIGTHLEALVSMGASVVDGPGHVLELPNGLRPTSIYLYEASVTGTETALLAAAAAPGISEIRHAACEPHVVELCEFLAKLGVGVTGAGTTTYPG